MYNAKESVCQYMRKKITEAGDIVTHIDDKLVSDSDYCMLIVGFAFGQVEYALHDGEHRICADSSSPKDESLTISYKTRNDDDAKSMLDYFWNLAIRIKEI